MRGNIDLTSNRMFPESNNQGMPIWLKELFYKDKCPWNQESREVKASVLDDEIRGGQASLVILGNNQERERGKRIADYEGNKRCERCGVYISKIPWSQIGSLCTSCNRELELQHGIKNKKPWKKENT